MSRLVGTAISYHIRRASATREMGWQTSRGGMLIVFDRKHELLSSPLWY